MKQKVSLLHARKVVVSCLVQLVPKYRHLGFYSWYQDTDSDHVHIVGAKIQTQIFVGTNFDILLTVHRSIFIIIINLLDAQNLFFNKFISCLYMFRAPRAHRQEVRIVLYSL